MKRRIAFLVMVAVPIFFVAVPCQAAAAEVIQPLKDMIEIQKVVDRIDSANEENSPFLSVTEEKTVIRVTEQGEFVFLPNGFALYKIYQVDINNDGKEEYVVVQSDGAVRMLGEVGFFEKDGRQIHMEWFEQLLNKDTSEADEQMAVLMRADDFSIAESNRILGALGAILSDADIGFKKKNGKTYVLVKRVHGELLEADDKTPYAHRADGATAEVLEYLLEPNGEGQLVKTTPVIYLGLEPLFYYQKSFGLKTLAAATSMMESMNEEYQKILRKQQELEASRTASPSGVGLE